MSPGPLHKPEPWPGPQLARLREDHLRLEKATVVSAVVGIGLWFALVPHKHHHSAAPRVSAYWWIMIAAAAVLGLVFGRSRAVGVACALAAPQFLLALLTAPRGDNDGLWVLWLPLLVGFGVLLILPAYLGGWVRDRIRSA